MTPKLFRTEEPEGEADAVATISWYDLQVRTSKATTPKDHMSTEGSETCFIRFEEWSPTSLSSARPKDRRE